MVEVKHSKSVEHIYIISIVFAFGLLFFANSDSIETPGVETVSLGVGKLFYLPCMTAFISSMFLKKKRDQYSRIVKILIFLAIISSLINPPQQANPMTWSLTRFVFGVLCFKDVRFVNPFLFTKSVTIASLLIIVPHYLFSSPFSYGKYRYAGFYGDPNFLAIALILLIVCCYITIKRESNVCLRFVGASSIILSIPLIFLGMSRSGLIGLTAIISIIMYDLFKTNKKHFFLVIPVIIVLFAPYVFGSSDLTSNILARFNNESDMDEYSSMSRIYGILSAINVFINNPIVIPFGIGLGNTVPSASEYFFYGYTYKGEIHNTFFSMMYEGGLIMACFYITLYLKIFKVLMRYKKYLLLALLFVLFLSLNTLPGISFMPAWISLFLLCNETLYKDTNDIRIKK